MDDFESLGIALGLGLLVGLQRQRIRSGLGGIRTFPLITLLGCVAGLLVPAVGGGVAAVGLLGLAALLYASNQAKIAAGVPDPGLTTEAAALLMYGVGIALGLDLRAPAVAVGGATAVLLHWKADLHRFVERLGEQDVTAVFQLALIALVILPILPNEDFGPYAVLNPFEVWLMVVLIVGISLAAYVVYRLLGARVGAVLGGLLGGLISSTATTVSYARQTRGNAAAAPLGALVVVLASTVVNVRILVELAIVAPGFATRAAAPFVAHLLVMAALCVVLLLRARGGQGQLTAHSNPAQLKAALVFGALYAVAIFLVAAAKEHFGDDALYGVAILSGLTDVDAITLSTGQLVNGGRLEPAIGWRVILVAALSNLLFKAGAVAVLGTRRLGVLVGIAFGVAIAAGLALLFLWPDRLHAAAAAAPP